MEEWLLKIYSDWKLYLIKLIWLLFIILFVIHFLFKWKAEIYLLEAEWSPGDLLAFAGSILSFLGTIVLGCVTVKLSKDNNDINKRLLEVENKREVIERDNRLGYFDACKIKINFYEIISEKTEHGTYFGTKTTEACKNNTSTIHFEISMVSTSNSIIDKIKNTSISISKYGFNDDFPTMTSQLCWLYFYKNTEGYSRLIKISDKTFKEVIVLSNSDRDTQAFEEMKKLLMSKTDYMIQLEYEFGNVLNESRKEVLRLVCRELSIIRTELVSIE
ncbi:hypothetical protein [Sedimentibacter saalensis]|uniref:hypothetical protein n=1 Tax=Sedimentibacter saalensis TaxID=130788 RepID=UPI00289D9980|nr:hypothetical protein [Sedimentibacter saalensis]